MTRRGRLLATIAAGAALAGAFAVLVGVLVNDTIAEHQDSSRIAVLVKDNERRVADSRTVEHEAREILCKLKRYDLVTGQPALQARNDRRSPEYDPARGRTLEDALRLVLSIPSASVCVALPPAAAGGR